MCSTWCDPVTNETLSAAVRLPLLSFAHRREPACLMCFLRLDVYLFKPICFPPYLTDYTLIKHSYF